MDSSVVDLIIEWVWAPIVLALVHVYRVLFGFSVSQNAQDVEIALLKQSTEAAAKDRDEIKGMLRDHNHDVLDEVRSLRSELNDRISEVQGAINDAANKS